MGLQLALLRCFRLLLSARLHSAAGRMLGPAQLLALLLLQYPPPLLQLLGCVHSATLSEAVEVWEEHTCWLAPGVKLRAEPMPFQQLLSGKTWLEAEPVKAVGVAAAVRTKASGAPHFRTEGAKLLL